MNQAAPESVGLSPQRLKRLDAVMQRWVESGRVAGVVTVLARRGAVAHVGCYGQMGPTAARPMQPDTIFRIYSMTKAVTSLAVMMLLEEGWFQLVHPIAAFLPELKDLRVLSDPMNLESERAAPIRPVTIYDLLTHTSGLGYGLDASSPIEAEYARAQMLRLDEPMSEKLARIAAIPLHHQPGARYTYSVATDVLGRLVEVISGQPLDEFFQTRIFEPLGMPDTGFFVPDGQRHRLADLVTPTPGGRLADITTIDQTQVPLFMGREWVAKDRRPAFLSGGGGLVSTAGDYLRFVDLLRCGGRAPGGERLVSRKTVECMTAPHLTEAQFMMPGLSAGFGLTVVTDPARAQLIASPGSYGGGGAAHTDFWVDPVEDMAGVFMIQLASAAPVTISMDFKTLAMQAVAD